MPKTENKTSLIVPEEMIDRIMSVGHIVQAYVGGELKEFIYFPYWLELPHLKNGQYPAYFSNDLPDEVKIPAKEMLFDRTYKIELLEKYSLFLEQHGYTDTDWRVEEPFAIDEFLKEEK